MSRDGDSTVLVMSSWQIGASLEGLGLVVIRSSVLSMLSLRFLFRQSTGDVKS